jgi:hypothetical protein
MEGPSKAEVVVNKIIVLTVEVRSSIRWHRCCARSYAAVA